MSKGVLAGLDIKNREVFAAQLSLQKLLAYVNFDKQFKELPRYPAVVRDISFILKEEVPIKKILEAAKETGRPLLSDVAIADYYKGKQIPPGYRGLTISCLYRSEERTLTEEEILPLNAAISIILTERFGAKIRNS